MHLSTNENKKTSRTAKKIDAWNRKQWTTRQTKTIMELQTDLNKKISPTRINDHYWDYIYTYSMYLAAIIAIHVLYHLEINNKNSNTKHEYGLE